MTDDDAGPGPEQKRHERADEFERAGRRVAVKFILALAEAARNEGMDTGQALRIVTATVRGSVALAESSGKTLSELSSHVRSKGGVTDAGLAVLEEDAALDNIVHELLASELKTNRL